MMDNADSRIDADHEADAPEAESRGAEAPPTASQTANPDRRKRLLLIFAAVLVVIAIGFGIYHVLVASKHAATDNAYVAADSALITPLVGGQVTEVLVSDTQAVKRGQVLMRIDAADARIAVEQAQADLAMAERRYGQTAATGDALAAVIGARDADIARARAQLTVAQADLQRARVDYDRRTALAASGAVSGDELTSATNALATAQGNVALARAAIAQAQATRASARQDRAANTALTRGTTAQTAPEVLTARARLAQAQLDLSRTEIRSPVDGIVTQRKVQVGQRLATGTTAMMVVPIDRLYVDANYKEGQLARVHPGQTVTMTSDLYGDDVVYHGRVVGFSGGTGSAFALIPAQNATGNWIKVVQRLPVRIAIDPADLRAHPLRVGLSMEVDVHLTAER